MMNPDSPLPALLLCTLRGSALILAALPLAPVLRRLLGPNAVHALWLAALAVLVWPWMPATPLSLANLWRERPAARSAVAAPPPGPVQVAVVQVMEAITPPPPAVVAAQPAAFVPAAPTVARPPRAPFNLVAALPGLWAVVAGALALRLLLRWARTRSLVRKARPLTPEERALLPANLPSGVELRVSPHLAAPALSGAWDPRVLLPEGLIQSVEPEALRMVLLHELGHHRRRDLVWEWLFAAALCLHWFNPLVWLAARRARHERELACDAWVLARAADPGTYGLALLEVLRRVGQTRRAPLLTVAMADRASPVNLRMREIGRYRAVPRWRALLVALPALLLIGALGTGRFAEARAEQAPASSPSPGPFSQLIENAPSRPGPILPFARYSEVITVHSQLLRVPEGQVAALGLSVAADSSNGIRKILTANDLKQLLQALERLPEHEIISLPRLVARGGQRTMFNQARQVRFPRFTPGNPVPETFDALSLGLSMEAETLVEDNGEIYIHLVPHLMRLTGLREPGGALTAPIPLPDRATWSNRLMNHYLPDGAGGLPEIVSQRGDVQPARLKPGEAFLVFGFRDSDPLVGHPAKRASQPLVNYILATPEILP
jgi:beta-lactamase regulating signal transducer with metallopeptidase domain